MRMTIRLADDMSDWLIKESENSGESISSIVRDALRLTIKSRSENSGGRKHERNDSIQQ